MIVRRVAGEPGAGVLREAAECIRSGGTLIFPTDTVYGIGCDPDDERAVAAVFAAKRRPEDRPLSIHLARAEDAAGFAQRFSPGARAVMRHFWPGGVTVIVARKPSRSAAAACGGSSIGLRFPDAPVCRAVLEATGPLAATSANVSGAPPFSGAATSDAALTALPAASLAIIAGPTERLRESTVLDCSGDDVRILRAGAVNTATLARALAGIASVIV